MTLPLEALTPRPFTLWIGRGKYLRTDAFIYRLESSPEHRAYEFGRIRATVYELDRILGEAETLRPFDVIWYQWSADEAAMRSPRLERTYIMHGKEGRA